MKVCIWYETTKKPYGGANTFLRGLAKELSRMGHDVITQPHRSADIILINSWSLGAGRRLTPAMVGRLKKYGDVSFFQIGHQIGKSFLAGSRQTRQPIVHRLDGVAALYGRNDDSDQVQIEINRFTDYTIFQSTFSKTSFRQLNVVPKKSTVIHNGVDEQLYYPDKAVKKPTGNLKGLAVSWSNNEKKGFCSLVELAKLPSIELRFIGNWPEATPRGNVQIMGVKGASDIAGIMRQSDILVHTAENDNCPNVVLEALASGLPILYKDSGGTSELAKDYGVPIYTDFENSVSKIRENYTLLRAKIYADLSMFSIKYAAKKYMNVFEELKSQDL